MTREQMVQRLADAIEDAIKTTQPQVCKYGEFEATEGRKGIGYDGVFDLYALADELFGRIS